MQPDPSPGISAPLFRELTRVYRREWPVRMAAIAPDGRRRFASGWWRAADPPQRRELLAFVLQEGLRWGEPTITYGEGGHLFWAVPLMHNAQLLGGLVATIHEDDLFPGNTNQAIADLRHACRQLRLAAEKHNLTNAALLEQRRWQYVREQERAELLRTAKLDSPLRVRQLYLQAEPELMNAIRRADRPQARAVLNQILTALLNAAGERFGLVRSFFIELAATMSRTAVEAGAEADYLLGAGEYDLARLARVEDMESLARCLREILELTIASLEEHRDSVESIVIANAVAYMREHLAQCLTRDRVADAMCLSPSHFSRLFKLHTGRTFSDWYTRLRIDHAAELLVRTDLPITTIADRCGFRDASYLGKVFRKQTGQTPRAYRLSGAGNARCKHDNSVISRKNTRNALWVLI